MELPFDSSTSGNISNKTWNTNSKEYKHPFVHCSIIYNSHDLEAAQVPTRGQVDKKAVVHLYSGILLNNKKGNLTFCDSMDGPEEHYAQWKKPIKER